MQVKVCPVCGKRNEPDAAQCSCDHSFVEAVMEMPVTADGRLLCPSCGRSCKPKIRVCPCGYGFDDDAESVHHMLVHELTKGWFTLTVGVLLVLTMVVVGLLYMAMLTLVGGFGLWFMVKGTAQIIGARRALRVYKLPEKLPAARLLKP